MAFRTFVTISDGTGRNFSTFSQEPTGFCLKGFEDGEAHTAVLDNGMTVTIRVAETDEPLKGGSEE